MMLLPEIELRELHFNAYDLGLLRSFYTGIYMEGFPDSDEREQHSNMERCLQLQGIDGAAPYHIVLALENERPVGGVISDYLPYANCGMIEFLVVASTHRGRGMARWLMEHTENLLKADAAATGRTLDCIAAEMENHRISAPSVGAASIARTRLWAGWGFRAFGFRYIQPALSPTQKRVEDLVLIGKILKPELSQGLASPQVRSIVRDYMACAMGIAEPEFNEEFQAMCKTLDGQKIVPMMPLI